MRYYTIGWNMPGYLPEMEPYNVEQAADARQAMLEELVRHADQDEMLSPDGREELDSMDDAIEDLNNTAVVDVQLDGWSYTTDQLHYWIDVQPGKMPEEDQ